MPQSLDFEELVDLYYVALYRFALSLTRKENDACDLTQQTFLVWARKGDQLQQPEKVKGWLFTTLYRQFLQSRRNMDRIQFTPSPGLEMQESSLPPSQARNTDATLLLEKLQVLDPAFRAPLALFYLENCSYLEISEQLEIPIGTVKSRISRAIRQLQSAMLQDKKTQNSPK